MSELLVSLRECLHGGENDLQQSGTIRSCSRRIMARLLLVLFPLVLEFFFNFVFVYVVLVSLS